MASALPATELAYFADSYKFAHESVLLKCLEEDGRLALVLQSTILYPQGGGQGSDTGEITSLDGGIKFCVDEVKSAKGSGGVVLHFGAWADPTKTLVEGATVAMAVDEEKRRLHARLHSAGHLLDAAMTNIGKGDMEPAKGLHTVEAAYVEYKGKIPPEEVAQVTSQLQEECSRLIAAGGAVVAEVLPYADARTRCSLPPYIAEDSSPRLVTVAGMACPCGGTHVADVAAIGKMTVTGIRVKKGTSRISYQLS